MMPPSAVHSTRCSEEAAGTRAMSVIRLSSEVSPTCASALSAHPAAKTTATNAAVLIDEVDKDTALTMAPDSVGNP